MENISCLDSELNNDWQRDVARPEGDIDPLDFRSEEAELCLKDLRIVTKDGSVNLQMPDAFYD